jgi:hypothetical protein
MTKLRRTKQNSKITCGGHCCDCGMATVPSGNPKPGTFEQFIVKDDIWIVAGMKPGKVDPKTYELVGGGFLCVGCIEERLGRRLTANDINPMTIGNLLISPWITDRLRSRILYPDQASEDAAKVAPPTKLETVLGEDGLEMVVKFESTTEVTFNGVVLSPLERDAREFFGGHTSMARAA